MNIISDGGMDKADVRIYMISISNRVIFRFWNEVAQVETHRNFVSINWWFRHYRQLCHQDLNFISCRLIVDRSPTHYRSASECSVSSTKCYKAATMPVSHKKIVPTCERTSWMTINQSPLKLLRRMSSISGLFHWYSDILVQIVQT